MFARVPRGCSLDRFRQNEHVTASTRARALWVKVRTVVLLNGMLRRLRNGERPERVDPNDVVQIKFVAVSEASIRDEIRKVQEKFSSPARVRKLMAFTPRQRVYLLLTEPTSSPMAMALSLLMFGLIFVSISSFIASTMPEHAGRPALDIIEMVCQLIFTLEYVVKISCAPKCMVAFKDPLNLIDLASIVPWYVELVVSGLHFGYTQGESTSSTSSSRVLRIFRLFRVIKVFRLGSRAKKIQVVLLAVQDSADMFVVLGFLLSLGLVMFSALIYFAERGQQTATNAYEAHFPGDFESIPAAFWWCMVTLMTVGYGDAVPVTFWGKVVASITMIGSVVITALPISVIGANFTQQWLVFKEKEHRKHIRLNLAATSSVLLREMFAYSEVISILSDHISAIECQILSEVNAIRGMLNAAMRMAETTPVLEMEVICRTIDVRYGKMELLREELKELVEMYELLSHTEFSVSLHQLKTIGNKMRKLAETGSMLDNDVETLVESTSAMRSNLFELREMIDTIVAEHATNKRSEYKIDSNSRIRFSKAIKNMKNLTSAFVKKKRVKPAVVTFKL